MTYEVGERRDKMSLFYFFFPSLLLWFVYRMICLVCTSDTIVFFFYFFSVDLIGRCGRVCTTGEET